jgi:hypothetical protein
MYESVTGEIVTFELGLVLSELLSHLNLRTNAWNDPPTVLLPTHNHPVIDSVF